MEYTTNCLILGSGGAGYTAGIYTARANLQPILITGNEIGGQLATTSDVENFPGFEKILGVELMDKMREQAIKCGAQIIQDNIIDVDFSVYPFVFKSNSNIYYAKTAIIATGAKARWLGLPAEKTYRGFGVSACAVCDGWLPIYRNQRIIVIWWWDVACEEAMYLTNFASEVIMLVRRDVLRASKAMQEKVLKNEKIKIMWHTEAISCHWDKSLELIKVVNNQTKEESEIECRGLFYAIWHQPNTEFLNGQLDMDETWYIITHDWVKTSVPWVFAAWDVQDKIYRQAITSAGTWCMAALEAEKFINDME